MNSQLEEANTLLRAETETATRLRKAQTESSKQLQQLEANVRELQDKCCLLERSKLSLEKECISLQAALESERREHSQGSETITDLMGRENSSTALPERLLVDFHTDFFLHEFGRVVTLSIYLDAVLQVL